MLKNNKIILLFFINRETITIDQNIVSLILENDGKYFSFFYYYEIKELIDKQKKNEIEQEMITINSNVFNNFDEKRKIGENCSYISSLIRQDSVEEFISYINRVNLSLSQTVIEISIFEINSFLIKKEPTLIEYSAFFGSIQIFNYLRFNNVELTPSLWIYSIHGKNAEIIHLLEENHVEPSDVSYNECLKEAIKCHHNDIARYIINNKMNLNEYDEKIIKCFFSHCNYSFFPNDLNGNLIFYYLCYYNYITLVSLYLKSKKNFYHNSTFKAISHSFFFLILF